MDTEKEYEYDVNGNMTQDKNKGISSIIYNHLNLPTKVLFDQENYIEYLYDAAGMKLQKKVIEGSKTTVTDYLDGYQYVDGVLEFYPHAEGYVNMKSGTPEYVYNYTDHLGNVRVSYVNDNGEAKIVEESNYYPFGLKHKGYNNQSNSLTDKYKYGFQGQELQDELDLNVIEFKYRFHDPAIGRFWQIDPLAEQYNYNSTYAFAENKLGLGIELEGLEVVPSYGMEYSNARTSEDYRRIQQAKNWQAAGAVAGAMFWGGAVAVAEVGWSGVASFVANEVKDEVLSQATGGASDVLDITKLGTKLLKEGFTKLSSKTINKAFTEAGQNAPYDEGVDVVEGSIKEGGEIFVRVHGEGNKASKWMMKSSEIEGLSAEQIKDKFALPELPTQVSDVNVPSGTKVRIGTAGKVDGWGDGGGGQVEVLQRLPEDAFTNTRNLE